MIKTQIDIVVDINEIVVENNIIQDVNFTTQILEENYGAVLGKPVKWKKTVKLGIDENKTISNLIVTLPKLAGNISVKKISVNKSVEDLKSVGWALDNLQPLTKEIWANI